MLKGAAALIAAPYLARAASGDYDVAIVGAGAAGLTAARKIAASGRRCIVVEAASRGGWENRERPRARPARCTTRARTASRRRTAIRCSRWRAGSALMSTIRRRESASISASARRGQRIRRFHRGARPRQPHHRRGRGTRPRHRGEPRAARSRRLAEHGRLRARPAAARQGARRDLLRRSFRASRRAMTTA